MTSMDAKSIAQAASELKERRQKRSMATRRSVIWGEKIAGAVITTGGLLVIVAVLGIMVFLFKVVMPLLDGGNQGGQVAYQLNLPTKAVWLNADEYQTVGAVVSSDGSVTNFHIPSGTVVSQSRFDLGEGQANVVSGTLDRGQIAFGMSTGDVRFATVQIVATATPQANLPAAAKALDGRDFLYEGAVFTKVQTGDYRTLRASNRLGEVVKVSDHPIIAIDYRMGGTVERPTYAFVTVDSMNVARATKVALQRNMMTGKTTARTETVELPALPLGSGVTVTGVLLSGSADRAIVSASDGMGYRFDLRDFKKPLLAEARQFLPAGAAITAMTFLSGEQSLAVGGTDGSLSVFFRLQREGAPTGDGFELTQARNHLASPGAITGLSEAQRDKSFVALDAKGNVRVIHSTSDQVLFEFKRNDDPSVQTLGMVFPRSDGVLLVSENGHVSGWQYTNSHPEITLKVLFNKIWYEGYTEPGWTWQSTAGVDTAEPKYSLVPLVFGTIKAAFYALLFGTPIALMAAIYTSEFVHRSVRATVKPVMETMESLPTVVLGFVAALILAPLVEEWIGAVLLGFIAVPMGLMVGAFVWQMLPPAVVLRFDGMPKFLLMTFSIFAAVFLAINLGPAFENVLFYGDFKAWTTGELGKGTPFLFLILLPLSYAAVAWVFNRTIGQAYRQYVGDRGRSASGFLDFVRWTGMLLAAMGLSYLVAWSCTQLGYDPRGGVIDSYQQRNALVVGFVMAFAVIPNIYTLAEDALNAVPGHLRAGSLACGATPWQTAMWVILPTAASGVFSAVMMGMGRAVGETMIVVMAAGNTPVMEMNIFSGLRTLSANIAIELPEAVKDGTNYRVLFLAALTLFIMTFIINTVAELIRQRFRKRAFQL